MGKKWDMASGASDEEAPEDTEEEDVVLSPEDIHANEAFHLAWLKEVFRILKPGGVAKVFAATRTMHRLAAAMQRVGFEELGLTAWAYGCLSEDTEVLTLEGWVQYHKAKVGTQVLGFDPKTECFTWQFVEETFEYPYDNTAFRIFSPDTDHIVSFGHRCLVQRDGKWDFRLSQECESLETVPCLQAGFFDTQSDMQSSVCKSNPIGTSNQTFIRTEGAGSTLHGLRETDLVCSGVVEEDQGTYLLQTMQRGASGSGLGEGRAQGCGRGIPGRSSFGHTEDARGIEPCLERGCDNLQEARKLREERPDQVSSVSSGVPCDGSQGRVCDGTSADCSTGTGTSADKGGDGSPHEPQSNGQQTGESGIVCFESGSQAVRASRDTFTDLAGCAYECLPSTARVESVHYRGIVWCVRVATGAFVARRKGQAFVTGNSGFPKSLNIQKNLEKMVGVDGSEVTTETSTQYTGYGTALKPAFEPFIVGRKPA